MKIVTYELNSDGEGISKNEDKDYSKIDGYKDFTGSIVLRVLEKDEGRSFINKSYNDKGVERHYVIKNATNAIIRFSDNGTKMAIFSEIKQENQLTVREIKVVSFSKEDLKKKENDTDNIGVYSFVDELNKNSKYVTTFQNEEISKIKDLKKLNLTFDRNEKNKYLAVYGDTMFKLFDLPKEKMAD